MKRRTFITLLGGAAAPLAWPLAAHAQQPSDVLRRVGALMSFAENDPRVSPRIKAFEEVLQQRGWIAGRNVVINYRWTAGDANRLRNFANELVGLTSSVILVGGTQPLVAAQQASRTIPIVFVAIPDPVGNGFVESLARPGGNATGFTNFEFSMVGKWLELLKEVVPNVGHAGLIFNPTTAARGGSHYLPPFQAAAAALSIQPIAAPVHDVAEIERTFQMLAHEPNGGLVVAPDNFTSVVHRGLIVALATKHRLPTVYPYRVFVEEGGLLYYGTDTVDSYRGAASYVDRILRGAKPVDMPVQQPTKFELVVNLKTAKALGLKIPESFLLRADEVIE